MTLSFEQTKDLIEKTAQLMQDLNIPIRDTWKGYNDENLDDGPKNGVWNGPRLVKIQIKGEGTPSALAGLVYEVPNYNSLAHNDFTICIPDRHIDHQHVFIHELVHFLQRTAEELNEKYEGLASPTIEDYESYVDQRTEREAHYVQLHSILKNEPHLIPCEIKEIFKEKLDTTPHDDANFPALCVFAKQNGLI